MKLLLITLIHWYSPCLQDTLPWQSVGEWKIYNVVDRDALRLPLDSLQQRLFTALPDSTVRSYLQNGAPYTSTTQMGFNGAYALSCTWQGKVYKIIASTHNGLLYDPAHKKYYQIGDEKQWEDFLQQKSIFP